MLRYLLINPPLTDPTAPYHSVSYLVGAAAAAGHEDFHCLDASLEALDLMSQEAQCRGLLDRARDLRERLEKKGRLTRAEEWRYRIALKGVGMEPGDVRRAVAALKDPAAFYDPRSYRRATLLLGRWLELLSLDGLPGQYRDFTFQGEVLNLSRTRDLTDPAALKAAVAPLAPYLEGGFERALKARRWDVIGLSVAYRSQLPFAVWMCAKIRELCPDAVLCAGGTEISDVVKYSADKESVWSLLPACDALVIGEGESAFVEILDAVKEGRALPSGRPGILLRGASAGPTTAASVRTEDLATLPAPRYDLWDWDRYWSPEPVVLYSPTRGCYWNKCAFCDYGLNTDMPTSPSRQRPLERVLDDLSQVARFARTVYFAVDAISPAYLRRLAGGLRGRRLGLRWAAELRLEKALRRDLASELGEAGCVAVSFGFESGSQRVLDLIDKGVDLRAVPELLRSLRRAGIGAQMMAFIGFPGETQEEAERTLDFLREQADHWALCDVGRFQLTSGAIVAKRAADFAVASRPREGEDINRELYWAPRGAEAAPAPAGGLRSAYMGERPFLGGVDSSHSILYFAKFGPGLVPPRPALEEEPRQTVLYRSPLSGVESFTGPEDLRALHQRAQAQGRSIGFAEVSLWLAGCPAGRTSSPAPRVLEILPNGESLASDDKLRSAACGLWLR